MGEINGSCEQLSHSPISQFRLTLCAVTFQRSGIDSLLRGNLHHQQYHPTNIPLHVWLWAIYGTDLNWSDLLPTGITTILCGRS